jgi:hypothetical protein
MTTAYTPRARVGGGTGSLFSRLHHEWRYLATCPAAARALARWGRHDTALAGYDTLAQLTTTVQDRTQPARSDRILAALVRLSAATGGDDDLATRTTLQLLLPGATRLARQVAAVTGDRDDAQATVAAELTIGIRTFPWQRRHRAIAANLLLDTRQRLTRARHRTRNEIPTGTDPHAGPHDRDHPHPGGIDTTETTIVLHGLLTWAHRNRVLDPFEIRLLIASHVHDIPVDHLAVVYGRSRSHLYAARAWPSSVFAGPLPPAGHHTLTGRHDTVTGRRQGERACAMWKVWPRPSCRGSAAPARR